MLGKTCFKAVSWNHFEHISAGKGTNYLVGSYDRITYLYTFYFIAIKNNLIDLGVKTDFSSVFGYGFSESSPNISEARVFYNTGRSRKQVHSDFGGGMHKTNEITC